MFDDVGRITATHIEAQHVVLAFGEPVALREELACLVGRIGFDRGKIG